MPAVDLCVLGGRVAEPTESVSRFRDEQDVRGRGGRNVTEGEAKIVLVHHLGRYTGDAGYSRGV